MSYAGEMVPPRAQPGRPRGRVARYAWGRDYHAVLKERMAALVSFVEAESRAAVPDAPRGEYRTLVDTARIVDQHCVQMMERTTHAKPRALLRSRDLVARPRVAFASRASLGDHFFAAFPALPSFLRIRSPSYRIPLPL